MHNSRVSQCGVLGAILLSKYETFGQLCAVTGNHAMP